MVSTAIFYDFLFLIMAQLKTASEIIIKSVIKLSNSLPQGVAEARL